MRVATAATAEDLQFCINKKELNLEVYTVSDSHSL